MEEAVFEGAGVERRAVEAQARLDALLALSFSSSSMSLTYEEIADTLKLEEEMVENWLLDKIMRGCIHGRLSQSDRTLTLNQRSKDWRQDEDAISQTLSMLSSIQTSFA